MKGSIPTVFDILPPGMEQHGISRRGNHMWNFAKNLKIPGRFPMSSTCPNTLNNLTTTYTTNTYNLPRFYCFGTGISPS